MKSVLKLPRSQRLKLRYDEPLSKFAFKSKLCRYIQACQGAAGANPARKKEVEAGAYTRPLLSSI
jgi:hypothetical protein